MRKQPFQQVTHYSDSKVQCMVINIKSAIKRVGGSYRSSITLPAGFETVNDFSERLKAAIEGAGFIVESWTCDPSNPFDLAKAKICEVAANNQEHTTIKIHIID